MKVETGISQRPAWMGTDKAKATSTSGKSAAKSLGEVPPVLENLGGHPELQHFFAHYGALQRLRRKLRQFSGRDAKLVLARNTVASVDDRGNVYVGLEFLMDYGHDEALLAGVLAHEWGHLMAMPFRPKSLDQLNWEEIFHLRREEEASADAFCGRMLALMDYPFEPMCDFLKRAETATPTVKYYAIPIRAAIIQEAHARHTARREATHKLFPPSIYPNPYRSKLILADD